MRRGASGGSCLRNSEENYLLDTAGALVTAIRAGAITTAQAEPLRVQIHEKRVEMDPRPFDELMKKK